MNTIITSTKNNYFTLGLFLVLFSSLFLVVFLSFYFLKFKFELSLTQSDSLPQIQDTFLSHKNEPYLGQPGVKNQAVLNLYSRNYNGDGTYYGEGTGGTCQYATPLPPAATNRKISALVALNKPQFLNSITCGICLKVTGSGHGLGANPITGDHIVFVKDLCPECHEGSVDFALNGDGRWGITIHAVQCPVDSSTIQYAFQGSNPFYLKLQVRNARIPITGVQVHRSNAWVTMTHSGDGYWLLSDGHAMPDGAFGIRLTAANGHVLEDTVPRIDNSHILEGGRKVQVPLDPSLPNA